MIDTNTVFICPIYRLEEVVHDLNKEGYRVIDSAKIADRIILLASRAFERNDEKTL
jgi:hypothetical protein